MVKFRFSGFCCRCFGCKVLGFRVGRVRSAVQGFALWVWEFGVEDLGAVLRLGVEGFTFGMQVFRV